MKKQQSLAPVVITRHPLLYVCAAFCLLFSTFLLRAALSQSEPGDQLLCLFVFLFYAGLGIALLLIPRVRKITVSTRSVTIEQKRGAIHAELPWDNFRFLYTLRVNKACFLLFSPVALNKQEQYAACEACRHAKDVPFVHNGCLALTGVVTLHQQTILRRLPESIRILPEHECGTLWKKRKRL